MIDESGGHYRKFRQVHARPAREGEVVVSVTTDGEETENTAKAGDIVVRNLTEAQELYLVSGKTFSKRYTLAKAMDDGWSLYDPIGEVLAVEITRDLTNLFGVGEEFFIMPSWKHAQLAREGDMFVMPLPGKDEIYRIARKEFDETYALVQPQER